MAKKGGIFLGRDLLKSNLFRGLGKTAKNIYFDFRMKCRVKKLKARPGRKAEWVILNNGDLVYTYEEAGRKGITRSAFVRAIDSLIEAGFIDLVHVGSGGRKGDVSRYGISDRWKQWGTSDFVEVKRPKDTRKDRGFAKYWRDQKSEISITNDTRTSNVCDTRNAKVVPLEYRERYSK